MHLLVWTLLVLVVAIALLLGLLSVLRDLVERGPYATPELEDVGATWQRPRASGAPHDDDATGAGREEPAKSRFDVQFRPRFPETD